MGRNEYGETRKVIHIESKSVRQVKILNAKWISKEKREAIANELNLLQELSHPNIEKIYEFFRDSQKVYIITDFYKGL